MLKQRLIPLFLALFLSFPIGFAWPQSASAGSQKEQRQDNMIAAVESGAAKSARPAQIPQVLSGVDVSLYSLAFSLEHRGHWANAERTLARISDPLLIGHVLARHYLEQGAAAEPAQLKDWLARYADLPEASAIRQLAQDHSPHDKSLRAPAQQASAQSAQPADDGSPMWEDFAIADDSSRPSAERRAIHTIKTQIRSRVWAGNYPLAVSMLNAHESKLPPTDADELKTVLALALFGDGRDADALPFATSAADRSGNALPEAHWLSGLILWRMGHRAESAQHFEAVASATGVSAWMNSAGAYWAARANLAARRPQVVNHWLRQAAQYPRTFYGLLARRALGLGVDHSWEAPVFTDADADVLLRVPAARRAMALLQIGETAAAEDELQNLAPQANLTLTRSMLALANGSSMPDLAESLGETVAAHDNRLHDASEFPLPNWRPARGWNVDRALILAIVRQESGFNPRARSGAGAVGLMQIMPATARALGVRGKLSDPTVNLEAGQHYISELLKNDAIHGNLMLMAAAYNSGPGAVLRWQQAITHKDDALLFMESIPSSETRVFVERVLTNFWTYRDRMGLMSPSLDSIAAGYWPIYDGQDSIRRVARHDQN